ncbi:MAG: hypothetical protein CL878_04250 [Dehalococcoidia bacterium]|nr:hypothetical protein [Dehalococcoidia bacterium]
MDTLLLGLLALLAILLVGVVILLVVQLRSTGVSHEQQTAALESRLTQLVPVDQAVQEIRLRLAELQAQARARQELERRTSDSIRRLEAVIAGTQTKGAAGENILELVFAQLPPEWQVRDFRVGNKTVEFGLLLPDGLVLPIDSKWAATPLLEQFAVSEDSTEQQRLKNQLEAAVLSRAREVRKYLDPNWTVNFGVAVVPDAAYDLCAGIQAKLFQTNVVLISYSLFVPYLLLVFQTMLKASRGPDTEKLVVAVQAAQASIQGLQTELEGRFARALTMLTNARTDMSMQLSKAASSLTSLQVSATPPTPAPALEEARQALSEEGPQTRRATESVADSSQL